MGLRTIGAMVVGLLVLASGGGNSVLADNDVRFSMTPDKAAYWRLVTDGVMGGLSQGELRFERDPDGTAYARMTGTVSTANNGGFIQFRAQFRDGVNFSKLIAAGGGTIPTGLRLRVRGNGETYFVHLRTRQNRRPWHYFAATFPTSSDWQDVELPLASFRHSDGVTSGAPQARDIISIGVVAYGRDHAADISVAAMTIY